ncbi:MAG TPA: CHAD domain-containing protein [Candidatus Acidoferrales bacterium]|nr:CHAD domain-containing protein [Candidatus Acidoferrales bacterium]
MPFYFKKAEKPGRAMRRVCQEHIRLALFRLRKSRHPAAIHAVRKEIKKLRAILHLMHGQADASTRLKLEKSLRRAARQLAASRDARVIFKAFENLAGRRAKKEYPRLHKLLEKNCHAEGRRFRGDDSAELAKRILQKAGRRIAHIKPDQSGWAAINPGLLESYRQGARAADLAARQPLPDHYHEWRKHVKTLWYQLRCLCPEWPAAGRAIIGKLDRLGILLGDDHDLALLRDFATAHPHPGETSKLNRLIVARQKKLRAAARKLGSQLYR